VDATVACKTLRHGVSTGHAPQATGCFFDSPDEAGPAGRDPGSMQRAAPKLGLPSTDQPQATSYKLQACAQTSPPREVAAGQRG